MILVVLIVTGKTFSTELEQSRYETRCSDNKCVRVQIIDQPLSSVTLKQGDVKNGKCYVMIDEKGKNNVYYKVTAVDKRVTYIFEDDKTAGKNLGEKSVIWDLREGKELAKWKFMECADTPNLGDAEYVSKCMKIKSYAGKYFCSKKSIFSK